MKQLPVLSELPLERNPRDKRATERSTWRSAAVFATRIGLLVVALGGLHQASQRGLARARFLAIEGPSLAAVQQLAPAAVRMEAVQVGPSSEDAGLGYRVFDGTERSLGIAITTSPEADGIVGYSGANNVLLLLDERQRVVAAGLLQSGDTAEHAAQVIGAKKFWTQFEGLAMDESTELQVDGVSGATLTSLAIAEGIQLRMSGRKLSLRFPEPITLAEVQALWPQVAKFGAIQSVGEATGLLALEGAGGEPLGWVARTGEVVDAEEGYQGPTELILLFDGAGVLNQVRIRKSFDNEPYVGYVKQEYSFWAKFKGRKLSELAEFNVEKEEIEGVSGATMTSLAVARTIGEAVRRLQEERPAAVVRGRWNWSLSELATMCLAGASLVWSRSKWRGQKWPRLIWQAVCVVVIGLWTGNLISLALLAGWTGSGVPYRLAPGLCVLLAVAVFWPAVSKQNVYCDHLCPHGALQQWMVRWRGPSSRRVAGASRVEARLLQVLAITPWIALVVAAGWLLFRWPVALAWLEPFDAYSWRIAWQTGLSVSAVVWIASIVLAAQKPMAYCRSLCPTGKVLDFVRRGKRMQFGLVDAGMVIVAVLAWWQAGLG